MSKLIDAKIEHLKNEELWFEMRFFAAMQHHFFEGLELDHSDGANRLDTRVNLGEKHSSSDLGSDTDRLTALKERLGWRGEPVERQENRATGASLLSWAVMADDVASVRQLLCSGSKDVKKNANRKLTRGLPEYAIRFGTTPLMIAMAFARWRVVELLLEAGANPRARDPDGKDALMFAAAAGQRHELGKDANVPAWLKRFPNWDIDRRDSIAGLTALHFAVGVGARKKAIVEALLQGGANPVAIADNGAHVLGIAAINPDLSTELLQWLLDYDNGILLPLLSRGLQPRTVLWRLIFSTTRFLYYIGNRNKLVGELAGFQGLTPLHDAARLGHHAITAVLAAAGASVFALTAQGLSPVQLARRSHGGKAPAVLEESASFAHTQHVCTQHTHNADSIMMLGFEEEDTHSKLDSVCVLQPSSLA
jgi:ankyrin repeat protein